MAQKEKAVQRRDKWVGARVSAEEYESISAKAKAAGGMATLLRDHMGRVQVVNKKQLREEKRRLTTALNRIGVNLNQIARHANQHKAAADAVVIIKHLIIIERQIQALLNRQDEGK